TWAKTFKLPIDYGEKELDLIFDRLGKMYVCNNEIFSNNMGFYWQYQSRFKGNLNELFNRESYVEIPWNLLLQNPLLTTEKYFNKIIDALSSKQSHSEYFFMIQNYQELNEDQINKMAEYLPTKNFYSYHNFFIEKNKVIFKQREDLAKLFKHKMTDYERSPFYYLNYPLEMQRDFVLGNSDRDNEYGFELVEKLNISNKEKLNLLNEVAKRLLNKSK
ncbi:hypothetical protein, partial [Cytobacillus praedii]|uniref:hypothetical protein n=1 Tax=Cytobacillus praedii TaxID=1742358 RepID=UPI0013F42BCF